MGVGAAAQPGPRLPPEHLIHCTQAMVRGTPPEHSTKVEPLSGKEVGLLWSAGTWPFQVATLVDDPCSGVELVTSLSPHPPWDQSLHL